MRTHHWHKVEGKLLKPPCVLEGILVKVHERLTRLLKTTGQIIIGTVKLRCINPLKNILEKLIEMNYQLKNPCESQRVFIVSYQVALTLCSLREVKKESYRPGPRPNLRDPEGSSEEEALSSYRPAT